jgi:rubrerythrin
MVNPTTPMKDPDYDVVLLLQQALEDCYRYQCFAEDARKAGDQELVDLFEELAESDREISERVKKILAQRLS